MIYVEATLDLRPASPETLDNFIKLAQEKLLPAYERLGLRLAAAWYSDVWAFCQVTHVLEFDSLAAQETLRRKCEDDASWKECEAQVDEMVFGKRTRVLEPLALPPETLHEWSAQSRENPLGVYTVATLEVEPGKLPQMKAALEATAKNLPMVANWRTVFGNPNEITDLWKGAVRQGGYEPSSEGMNAFFRGLRQVAPKETLVPVFTLPYSPLR